MTCETYSQYISDAAEWSLDVLLERLKSARALAAGGGDKQNAAEDLAADYQAWAQTADAVEELRPFMHKYGRGPANVVTSGKRLIEAYEQFAQTFDDSLQQIQTHYRRSNEEAIAAQRAENQIAVIESHIEERKARQKRLSNIVNELKDAIGIGSRTFSDEYAWSKDEYQLLLDAYDQRFASTVSRRDAAADAVRKSMQEQRQSVAKWAEQFEVKTAAIRDCRVQGERGYVSSVLIYRRIQTTENSRTFGMSDPFAKPLRVVCEKGTARAWLKDVGVGVADALLAEWTFTLDASGNLQLSVHGSDGLSMVYAK